MWPSLNVRTNIIAALGAQVLGISVDSQFSHLAWMNTDRAKGGVADIQIPLVSDITKEISKAYEVLVNEK
jgi:peroxiredoxin (alkyl hydroperoxide reductase subunit C)